MKMSTNIFKIITPLLSQVNILPNWQIYIASEMNADIYKQIVISNRANINFG